MDFRELFRNLDQRPTMFLPDTRYNTVVAFVEGCNAATDRELLRGFSGWVHDRILGYRSNFHWQAVIAAKYLSGKLDERWQESIKDESFHDLASHELLAQLDDFLAARVQDLP